jgi:hypothetical protein
MRPGTRPGIRLEIANFCQGNLKFVPCWVAEVADAGLGGIQRDDEFTPLIGNVP